MSITAKNETEPNRLEIANPHDKATIDCSNPIAACIAVALVGNGAYGIIGKATEAGDGNKFISSGMPIFIFGGCDEWFSSNFGFAFEEAFNKTDKSEIIRALESIELVYERTSVNDFQGRAKEIAKVLRADDVCLAD